VTSGKQAASAGTVDSYPLSDPGFRGEDETEGFAALSASASDGSTPFTSDMELVLFALLIQEEGLGLVLMPRELTDKGAHPCRVFVPPWFGQIKEEE
jgi:hypothetical protein